MPELPEVETIVTELRPSLVGQRILEAHVLWPRTVAEPDLPAFAARVAGREIVALGRRGKHILMHLDSGETLIIHLRMTGRLEVVSAAGGDSDARDPGEEASIRSGPHVRAWFALPEGRCLVFTDARKFGRIWLTGNAEEVLGRLGPEPLAWDFSAAELAARVRRRRVAIKALLLDQSVVAGLGNIYADEALFLACIHPLRPGSSLDDEEIGRLHESIRQVLHEAIGQRGTTLRDYRPPYGLVGAYQNSLRVYQQTDLPCPRCGTPIQRIRVTQRSTHFCPRCQPEPDRPTG